MKQEISDFPANNSPSLQQNYIREEVVSIPKKGKNIYKRKDGRWEGRYIKCHSDGKSKYGYVFGKCYEETEAKLEAAISKNLDEKVSSVSFKVIAEEWLEAQKTMLKASSVSKYKNTLNTYLLPQFGDKTISGIGRNDVSVFSKELLISGGSKSNGLAPKTVNGVLSVLKNIFLYAAREKEIAIADIKDLSVKQPQKPMRILSIDEQQRLSRYLQKNLSTCFLGILICMYTGLRIGEICALKWKDICINEQYLFIH